MDMSIPSRTALFLAIICTPLLTQSARAQGALMPPAPPGPTMKTLDQLDAKLEARTPISSLPFTISEPGSYYLTRNLEFTAASGHAITIAASNVTLDLNGFTLSSTAGVTGNGINVAGGRNVAVRNGAITGTTTVTITGPGAVNPTWVITRGGFANGIRGSGVNGQFEHLRISGCREDGLNASAAVVDHVSASENGSQGISSGLGTVTNSIARTNGSIGISSSTVTNCSAASNQGAGITGSAVSDSSATFNGNRGISSSGAIKNCYAIENGDTGILSNAGSVTNCTSISNKGDGIYGVAVIGCLASENRTHGIVVRGTARDNESNSNGNLADGAGIYFTNDGVRIEGNNCSFNDWGIRGTSGTDSLIIRNSCRGNSGTSVNGTPTPENGAASANYDFPNSNTFGPIVIVSGNVSAVPATSHPLVNISY